MIIYLNLTFRDKVAIFLFVKESLLLPFYMHYTNENNTLNMNSIVMETLDI